MTPDATRLRYSEITPAMESWLRVLREVEKLGPANGDKATRTLDGLEQWRTKKRA